MDGDRVGGLTEWPEPSGDCVQCQQRRATGLWVGEGGSLGLVHGQYQSWCTPCILQAQLEHAKERSEAIPGLERELVAALEAEAEQLRNDPHRAAVRQALVGIPSALWNKRDRE